MEVWVWIIAVIIILVLVVLIAGLPIVTPPRRESFEGIEDPEAVKAYDRMSQWPQFKYLRRMFMDELETYNPKGIMVDLGCGPGYLVTLIARAFLDLNVVGVDIAKEMAEATTQNMTAYGLSNRTKFLVGDNQRLPLKDASVDFVVSTLSLHHWSDPKQAMLEIYRILKPQGQLLLLDANRENRRMFYWLIRFVTRFIVPSAIRHIKEPLGSFLSSYTPKELEALFEEIPFQEHRIKPKFVLMFFWGRKA
jgi:ubiquinone/menaquinone biosynthesis C-methylase UbiE